MTELPIQFRPQTIIRNPSGPCFFLAVSGDFVSSAARYIYSYGERNQCILIWIYIYIYTGQLAASLSSLSRTVDDYSALSKKELIPEKQEKAFDRIKKFRTELVDYRQQFDRLKKDREDAVRFAPFPIHCTGKSHG